MWQGFRQSIACGAGETRLHCSIPFLGGAVALLCMALSLEHNPSAAFLSLLGATVIWGSGGVVYGLPASFLSVSARALNVLSTTSLGRLFMSTMLSGDSVRQPGHALSLMRLTCSRFLSDWGVTGWSSTGPDSLVAVCAGTLGCCRDSNREHVWSLWGSRACAGGPHEGEAVALYVIII